VNFTVVSQIEVELTIDEVAVVVSAAESLLALNRTVEVTTLLETLILRANFEKDTEIDVGWGCSNILGGLLSLYS
jgi:hypothetical protein